MDAALIRHHVGRLVDIAFADRSFLQLRALVMAEMQQYLMAADRDNPKVNHLCQPLSPAVLRLLHKVISTCNAAGTPVSLCGEMAGQPRSFVLLPPDLQAIAPCRARLPPGAAWFARS